MNNSGTPPTSLDIHFTVGPRPKRSCVLSLYKERRTTMPKDTNHREYSAWKAFQISQANLIAYIPIKVGGDLIQFLTWFLINSTFSFVLRNVHFSLSDKKNHRYIDFLLRVSCLVSSDLAKFVKFSQSHWGALMKRININNSKTWTGQGYDLVVSTDEEEVRLEMSNFN